MARRKKIPADPKVEIKRRVTECLTITVPTPFPANFYHNEAEDEWVVSPPADVDDIYNDAADSEQIAEMFNSDELVKLITPDGTDMVVHKNSLLAFCRVVLHHYGKDTSAELR